MRGIFASGLLDVFHEREFLPFDLVIGTSAGACTGACFLADQHRRNYRVFVNYMASGRFKQPLQWLRGGSYVDLDWLWDVLAEEDPLDCETALHREHVEFLAVATYGDTGEPAYINPTPDTLLEIIKGSSALPIIYRGENLHQGRPLVDGGVADPIPVQKAYEMGAREIMVVRSRPAQYRKSEGLESRLSAAIFRKTPGLAQAVRTSPRRYAAAVDFIEEPPEDARILHVAPPALLQTGRLTQDKNKLESDYELGRRVAEQAIADWEKLVG